MAFSRYIASSPAGKKAGTPLANGFFGVLWALAGDLDYYCKTLGLPRWSGNDNPCALCRCAKYGRLSWLDNRNCAPWQETEWSPSEWKAWEGKSTCPIFSLPGVSACTVAYDYMHAKYLGLDQFMFGAVLYMLVFVVMPADRQSNLEECWSFIKQYYKDHKVAHRFRYLNRPSMFVRKSGYAKLRGKAAEISDFGKPLLALWKSKMSAASQTHVQIKLMLLLNVRMEEIMEEHAAEFKFPPAAAKEFKETAFQMCQLQVMLMIFSKMMIV